ncbi:MAG: prohibitin family protein [Burkholderiaceae bacterium]|nr:prohibitin family protein [Burkholderiaceae bacterium]MDP4968524.1 prohibitin family protein [Burkholderiaceae bacterium]
MQKTKRHIFSRAWNALLRWAQKKILTIFFLVVLLVSSLIVLWPRMFVLVPAGNIGVIYRPLSQGVDLGFVLREGAYLILPWNKVTQYTVQIQLKELHLELMTSDLLKTNVTVSFQFEANPNTLPLLHKYVGVDYLEKLIIPQVIKVTREKVAQLNSRMAYTGDIGQVASDIAITTDNLLIQQLSPPGLSNVRLIRVSSVQLTSVLYPPFVQAAIDNKVVESEIAEAYKFKIQASRLEAERKVIEATGIRDFQNIVNEGMTENYLRFRGIQATEELAKSSNAKTLIFGSGPSGLPLVLGNAVDNAPPGAIGGTVIQDPLKQPVMQSTESSQTKKNAVTKDVPAKGGATKDVQPQESPTNEPPAPAAAVPIKK